MHRILASPVRVGKSYVGGIYSHFLTIWHACAALKHSVNQTYSDKLATCEGRYGGGNYWINSIDSDVLPWPIGGWSTIRVTPPSSLVNIS